MSAISCVADQKQPLPPLPMTVRHSPVYCVPEIEARAKLAAAVSFGDQRKALIVMRLPLFRVALEGVEGMHV